MKREGKKCRWDAHRRQWERERRERVARMTAEARATYHRIIRLRNEIGPVDFDINESLEIGELRRIMEELGEPAVTSVKWTST